MGSEGVGRAAVSSSPRWGTALVVALVVLSLALTAAGLALLYVTRAVPIPDRWGFRGFAAIFAVLSAGVGAAILSRHPRNPVGWIFLALGLQSGLQVLAEEYAVYAMLYRPGGLGGAAAAWVQHWVWILAVGLLFPLVLLLFPSGRLLSARWRYVVGLTVSATAFFFATYSFLPGPVVTLATVNNPLGVVGAQDVLEPLMGVGFLAMGLGILASAVSLVLRLRRARGEEREQLKWFTYAGSLAALGLTHSFIPTAFLEFGTPTEELRAYSGVAEVVAIASICLIYIAAGIAMLKYRLYDINLVINRTLVYVPLTAALAGVYIALIGVFKSLLTTLTGVGSDAAVALTTLAVVALLTPLKNYFQAVVDRYFRETRDPSTEMARLESEVLSVVEVLDGEEIARRLLDTTVAAFDCPGGAIYRQRDGTQQLAYSRGEWTGVAELAVPLEHDGRSLGEIRLGPRHGGGTYSERDLAAIRRSAVAVARALSLVEGGAPLPHSPR